MISPKSDSRFYFLSLVSILLIFRSSSSSSSSFTLPDRYLKSVSTSLRQNLLTEYFELTPPLPTDQFTPTCSLLVLQEDFGNTIGSPPATAIYSPPSGCPGPWSHVVLEFRASCEGEQYDRIAGVWLDGVEILRTSTAEPTESGVFWKVRKDVTRYSSLLAQSNLTLAVMLENVVNDEFTGVYHVNLSLLYYGGDQEANISDGVTDWKKLNRKLGFLTDKTVNERENGENLGFLSEDFEDKSGFISKEPGGGLKMDRKLGYLNDKSADLVIPISEDGDAGHWFRIQGESHVHGKKIQIPKNTYKAVLEIYVSFHGNDEFWYSNPPNAYIELNNLSTARGNGAFRQVVATIDGMFVGSVEPFPVIFTGGINPLFWEPIVAVGAFDLPSYDLDLTPFLSLLLDGKNHFFGFGVTKSIPFWLVDANLHLWLDPLSPVVSAKSVLYKTPAPRFQKDFNFDNLDGKFKIRVQREVEFSGWVVSSAGNFTTRVSHKFRFKNSIKFRNGGKFKDVEQRIKTDVYVWVLTDTQQLVTKSKLRRRYPLDVKIYSLAGPDIDTRLFITNVSHTSHVSASFGFSQSEIQTSVTNRQVCGGWMVVQDHSVQTGTASTNQTLRYCNNFGCNSLNAVAIDGKLLHDN